MLVFVTIKKRSYVNPLGQFPLECADESEAAIEAAMNPLETAEFGGWVYPVLERHAGEKLLVVENYPTAQIVAGELVAM
ncbi:hypothetical protein KC571_03610 [candidate division WWE3 bacterium]|uniref:Uncharacterized protein n=1 Tax=candidate division WWE3 bacterium TaxID=2053526 RepID=A0A955LH95_UNCKA|nr:hypothetical protein [candidate division WWE3 bacterium]